jgi:hypothetical protein
MGGQAVTEEYTGSARPWPCRYCHAGPDEPCRHAAGWRVNEPHGSRYKQPKKWRLANATPVDAASAHAMKVLPENVWPKIEFTAHCWVWLGALNGKGYGTVRHEGRTWLAHKLAYELLVGPVPDGLQLDHRCVNKPCCNPAHLEPVTPKQNVNRHHIAKYGVPSSRDTADPTYVPIRIA